MNLLNQRKRNQVENQPRIIHRKTIKLRVDEYDDIKLSLKKGNKITGKVSSDGFFDIYFLTESSFRSFKNDNNFQYDGSEVVSHFEPQFEATRKGIFYVVLQNADKKNIVVEMDLCTG